MKVLAIAHNAKPVSGWGRYAFSVFKQYEALGVDYRAITAEGDGSTLLPPNSPVNLIRNALRTRRMAKDSDIIHAFDVWPFALYGYAAVLGTKKKLFITAVGTYSIPPKQFSLKRSMLVLALRRAEKIFAISDYTRKRLIDSVALDNTVTVYMGSSDLPGKAESPSLARDRFSIPENASPVLLTVGQIKHRKGQLDTLNAVSILKKEYPNILYLIVGSDSDTEYVRKIRNTAAENGLGENIRIISDAATGDDLTLLYSASDVFVMNSNNDDGSFEGFGLVFLEAAGYGKPVVGSRGSGIEEALEDGYNGYLAEPKNSEDIAEKIRRVLSGDPAELSRHSLEFYSRFSWEKTVKAYLSFYRQSI